MATAKNAAYKLLQRKCEARAKEVTLLFNSGFGRKAQQANLRAVKPIVGLASGRTARRVQLETGEVVYRQGR